MEEQEKPNTARAYEGEPITAQLQDGEMNAEIPTLPYTCAYHVTQQLEGIPSLDYILTVPANTESLRLEVARPRRDGGYSPADTLFQSQIFSVVGAITVAGGHIEMAMKQLILVLSGGDFDVDSVRDMWDQLEKRLYGLCTTDDGQQNEELRELLDGARTDDLREQRNSVVHGYWWLYETGSCVNARFPRKGESYSIHTSLNALSDLADKLFIFAQRLEKLSGENWPVAILPKDETRNVVAE